MPTLRPSLLPDSGARGITSSERYGEARPDPLDPGRALADAGLTAEYPTLLYARPTAHEVDVRKRVRRPNGACYRSRRRYTVPRTGC